MASQNVMLMSQNLSILDSCGCYVYLSKLQLDLCSQFEMFICKTMLITLIWFGWLFFLSLDFPVFSFIAQFLVLLLRANDVGLSLGKRWSSWVDECVLWLDE